MIRHILTNSTIRTSSFTSSSCVLLINNLGSPLVKRSFGTSTTLNTSNNRKIDVLSTISSTPFPEEVASVLMAPLPDIDIEVLPEGSLFLPEIKYRRILNKAFLPGGWSLVPLSDYQILDTGLIIQEFALFCRGQFVSQTFGEQTYEEGSFKSIGTALEGCKSNALMRCCKDLGIASELWDPNFINEWKKGNVLAVLCENAKTKNNKVLYRRKDRPAFQYPWTEKSVVKK